jgi:hemoglobin-like flavoprotein
MDYNKIFNDSHARIFHNERVYADFFSDFYKVFFARGEHITKHFVNTDLKKQKLMLRRSFLFMIDFHANRTATDKMLMIAQTHDRVGITPDLYEDWLTALTDNVKNYDPKFNDDVELSWRLTMLPGIEYFRFYYSKKHSQMQ